MLWEHVLFDYFWFDPAAAHFWFDHVFESLIFFLEEDFGVVYFLFLDLGDKSTVEVRFWTFVEQILVTAVLFKDEKDLVVDVHVVEDADSVFLFVQQFVEVFKGGFFEYGLI